MEDTTTWFQTEFGKISPVQVVRHTERTVTVKKKRFYIDSNADEFEEVRRNRITDWQCYFPTWEEAHAHLMAQAESKLLGARRALEVAQSEFGNVKGMKPPKEPTP